jgi:tetratricopeptide (TPR) repeat protein
MSAENANKCTLNDLRRMDPLTYAKDMEHLRTTFGWSHYALPEMVKSEWVMEKDVKHRFCFYFEMPERIVEASSEIQENYLKALLKLRTGEDLPFTRETERGKFLHFEVSPKFVEKPLNKDAYPFPIVMAGDSLMSPEYRSGTGVRNGIECANALINAVAIKDKVSINEGGYNFGAQPVIDRHKKDVMDRYQAKRNALANKDLVEAYKMYERACDSAIEKGHVPDIDGVKNGLKVMAGPLKAVADSVFTEAIKGGSREKFIDAERLYTLSLSAYKKYWPADKVEEKWIPEAKTHLNLARVNFQLKNVAAAFEHVFKVIELDMVHDLGDFKAKPLGVLATLIDKCTVDESIANSLVILAGDSGKSNPELAKKCSWQDSY